MFTTALAVLSLLPAPFTATREDTAGWIIVHLKGTPYEVGYQHGSLLSNEIADAIQTAEADGASHKGQEWNWLRATAERICWPKTDPEYQQEIKGIADALKAKGIQRDWKDVLALNAHIELWDYYAPMERAKAKGTALISEAPMACSAFVATGSATRDGRPGDWAQLLVGLRHGSQVAGHSGYPACKGPSSDVRRPSRPDSQRD